MIKYHILWMKGGWSYKFRQRTCWAKKKCLTNWIRYISNQLCEWPRPNGYDYCNSIFIFIKFFYVWCMILYSRVVKGIKRRPSPRPWQRVRGRIETVHGLLGCNNPQCIQQGWTYRFWNRDRLSTCNMLNIVISMILGFERGPPYLRPWHLFSKFIRMWFSPIYSLVCFFF